MTMILEIKEKLKRFYAKFDIYILAIVKFFGALIVLSLINANIGYMEKLKEMVVVLLTSLLCSILPVGAMAFICAGFVIAHFYTISLELAAITLVLFVLMFCLYIRFDTSDCYIILLTPVLFWLKIPYLIPLLVGLTGSVTSIVPIGMGVIGYYLLDYAKTNAAVLANSTAENILQKFTLIIDGIIQNKLMMLTVIVFAIVTIVVYLIKKLAIDYSFMIAIGVGTILNILLLLLGDFRLDIAAPVLGIIMGSLISAVIMLVLQFLIFSVDYTRTEHVQFEDDDYIYYVKAVPKMSVTTQEINVKKINAQRAKKNIERR